MLKRGETICQLEKCAFIMDKLLKWQKLSEVTDDFKRLIKELGNELTGNMLGLTRNLKKCRLEQSKNEPDIWVIG